MAPPPPRQDRIATQLERAERRAKAVELANGGMTYANIALKLGYNSAQAAHRDVKAGLAPALKELRKATDAYLVQQVERLDEALRVAREVMHEYGSWKPDPLDPDARRPEDQRLAAVAQVVKVSERVSKLLGLDAPTKTDSKVETDATVTYQVAVAPEELEQL